MNVRFSLALFLSASAIALTTLGLASGCSTSKMTTEPIGTTSEALEAGTTSSVSPTESQPSIVSSGGRFVVGYDDFFFGGFSAGALAGWGFSTNALSWTKCNMVHIPGSTCNMGHSAVLAASQQTWLGQTSVVADGKHNVMYVNLAGSTTTPSSPVLVVAVFSNNDGQTFGLTSGHTLIVNENGGGCDNGIQDLPNAAVDLTTNPPTFWVVWRHETGSSFGGCVRRGQFQGPNFKWIEPAQSIGSMDKENGSDPNMGQGGMRIQAGDGIVAVAYSNNDEMIACPDFTKSMAIRWGMVTSFDNGHNWGSRSSVFHTTTFQPCTLNGHIQNSKRAFDFVRTPGGNYYVAVNDTPQSIRLFHSPASGVSPSGDGNAIAWREFCPGTPTSDASALPVSSWTQPGFTCPTPIVLESNSAQTVFFPTLTTDGNDRISLTYYEGTNPDKKSVHVSYLGSIGPRLADAAWEDAMLTSDFVPNSTTVAADASVDAAGAVSILGSYMSITSTSRIANETDSCQGVGVFYPAWTFVSPSSGLQQVQAVSVTIP